LVSLAYKEISRKDVETPRFRKESRRIFLKKENNPNRFLNFFTLRTFDKAQSRLLREAFNNGRKLNKYLPTCQQVIF